jgi:hypothetical protein
MAAKVERVACNICKKEVPQSEAVVPEVTDILIFFCGLVCYDEWKNLNRRQDQDDIRRAIDDGMQDLRMKKN